MEQNIYPIECSDGIDNNGNGVLDGADQGCVNGWDNNEFALSPVCMDGIDNDGDGWIDEEDTDCIETSAESGPDLWQCSDFVDNNGDGLSDADDSYCLTAYDNVESDGLVYNCTDGLDNDGDGWIDDTTQIAIGAPRRLERKFDSPVTIFKMMMAMVSLMPMTLDVRRHSSPMKPTRLNVLMVSTMILMDGPIWTIRFAQVPTLYSRLMDQVDCTSATMDWTTMLMVVLTLKTSDVTTVTMMMNKTP